MRKTASTTRRDFLSGRTLADAVEARLADAVKSAKSPAAVHDSLLRVSRRAMACNFEIVLDATEPFAVHAAYAALDEIDRLEEQLTVYSDLSEVSRINALAATGPMPVEPRLFQLFQTALRLNAATDGAFDMTAGALVKCWGFFRGPKRVPPNDELAAALEQVGSHWVELDAQRSTISFRRPGVEINLGAIGKGYALDRAAELLIADWKVGSALLHGGRSSVRAAGSSDWVVAIAHPLVPDCPIAKLHLREAALGTSGATLQYFEANGRRFGHIVDPRTGWPAQGQTCVSVIAPTAAEADALSTALFILGPDRAREFCVRHPEIGAILVNVSAGGELDVQAVGRATELVEMIAGSDDVATEQLDELVHA